MTKSEYIEATKKNQVKNEKLEKLADCTNEGKPWDQHRSQADQVMLIYAQAESEKFFNLASRMNKCADTLWFEKAINEHDKKLKLHKALFCRARYCPVCQWRRSLMWQARFYQLLPALQLQYPKSRFLFLTLTVRNCKITDLRKTLKAMNEAWQRLLKLKEFKIIQGWIRTTEVTRSEDRSAHPHFHILLMVPPSYFNGESYVKQSRWIQLWRESLRIDYDPSVHIKVVKSLSNGDISGAIHETLKYGVKPSDMVEDKDWFIELTEQTHKLRFVASGGIFKNFLKPEKTNDDLLIKEDTDTTNNPKLAFKWQYVDKSYYRYPQLDNMKFD